MLIDRRYRVLRTLGQGMSGDVYLVEDERTHDRLALKSFRLGTMPLSLAQAVASFKQEFALLQALRHPHIARIADFGCDADSGRHYFTEEYIDGVTLFEATASTTVEHVEGLCVQVLRALEFLHARQVAHFDLKPGNVLVESASGQVKVIDFGLANLPGQSLAGTPAYMAPEICLREPRDGRADLYALGVIWYKCLARRNPFEGGDRFATCERQVRYVAPPISHTRPEVPGYLDTILARLLAKSPVHRYPRAALVIRDLNFLGRKHYAIETGATSAAYLPEDGEMIGREAVWTRILQALEASAGGAGCAAPILLVSGDRGMGKTRLCREARYYAQLQGRRLTVEDYSTPLTPAAIGALRERLLHPAPDAAEVVLVACLPVDAEALAPWIPPVRLQPLVLTPLSAADITRYLSHVTGIALVPPALVAALHVRTHGNPRWLRELLGACFARHLFFDTMGRWTQAAFADLHTEIERLPIPSAMHAWFSARAERLPTEARRALDCLAVCRHPIPRVVLEQAALPPSTWVEVLTAEGWITWQDESIALQNPAAREWLLSQLPVAERMQWHDHIATMSAYCPAEDLDYHHAFGSDPLLSLPALVRYTDRLIQTEEWPGVVAALAWGWQHLQGSAARIDMGLRWVNALIEAGAEAAIESAIQEVGAVIDHVSPADRVLRHLTLAQEWIEWRLRHRDFSAARQRIEALLDGGVALPPAEAIRLRNYLGRILMEAGDLAAAADLLRSTWSVGKTLPLEDQRRTMNNDLGMVYLAQGEYQAAQSHFLEELGQIERLGDRGLEARCCYNLGEAARGMGHRDEAARWLDRAYAIAQAIGQQALLPHILNAIGNGHHVAGATTPAIEAYERGLHLAERLGDRASSAALATNLGILLHVAHRNADALSYLSYADHLLRHGDRTATEGCCLARCLLEKAALYRDEGKEEAAKTALAEGRQLALGAGEQGADTAALLPFMHEVPDEEPPMKPTIQEGHAEASPTSWQRLLQITQQLAQATEMAPLLQQILQHAVTLAGAEIGLILLLDTAGALRVEAALNVEPDAALRQTSRTLAMRAIEADTPLCVDDAALEESFREAASVIAGQFRSICCLPIHAMGRVIGCLYLSHRVRPAAFHAVDRDLLAAFADQAGLAIDRARLLVATASRADQLAGTLAARESELSRLEAQLQSSGGPSLFRCNELQSRNAKMGQLFQLLARVLPTDLSVFLHGDTGTGKEVLARMLHARHPVRAKGPLIAVSCGAIPKDLMESEMFGYRAGAFTGAVRDKVGLFEAAHGGTLFLDEIAELPLELQAKLLRVLQEREIRRLGETTARSVDCRILSASHRDLRTAVTQGAFREDLYYRLCQIQIDLPPLRERREDIPLLIDQLLATIATSRGVPAPAMDRTVLRRFFAYDWPGNIRELEHLLQAMCALCDGKTLRPCDIPPHHALAAQKNVVSRQSSEKPPPVAGRQLSIHAVTGNRSLETGDRSSIPIDAHNTYDPATSWHDYEQRIIAAAYRHYGHNARLAAAALGISPAKMYKWIRQLHLTQPVPPVSGMPFHYQEGTRLTDYLVKIFAAALLAAGKHPYAAIRALQVSPGYFYKIVPVERHLTI